MKRGLNIYQNQYADALTYFLSDSVPTQKKYEEVAPGDILLSKYQQLNSKPGDILIGITHCKIGSKVYFFGGYDSTGSSDLWIYDIDADNWISLSTPVPYRSYSVAGTYDNKLYIHAGIDVVTSTLFGDMWEYDPDTNQWTQKSSLIQGRFAPGAAVIGNKFYVACGTTTGPSFDFYEYDFVNDTYTNLPTAPYGLNNICLVAWQNKLFQFGGDSFGVWRDFVYMYDVDAQTWTQKTSLPAPRSIGYKSGVVYKNDVYLFGGWDSANNYFDIWKYDIINDTFTQLESMTNDKLRSAAVWIYKDQLFWGTGYDGTSWQNFVWNMPYQLKKFLVKKMYINKI